MVIGGEFKFVGIMYFDSGILKKWKKVYDLVKVFVKEYLFKEIFLFVKFDLVVFLYLSVFIDKVVGICEELKK